MAYQPSRTSLQGSVVNKMKTDIAQIVAVLDEWAGKEGKPAFRTAEVNSLCTLFDDHLEAIANSRQWSSEFVNLWRQFKAAWQGGDGSWTESKRIAKRLNDHFRDVEG
jgi:hypothetical protein